MSLPTSLWEMSQALFNGECSSVELTSAAVQRVEQTNPELNYLITLCGSRALKQAAKADAQLAQLRDGKGADSTPKWTPSLLGIPIIHKDLFCTEGIPTTCGSAMLKDWLPPYSATVVQCMEKAGAITIGKANMDEFAMGSSNETSHFGPVRNPWRSASPGGKPATEKFVPGGSSGGSAVAVACNAVPIATGTDTGGSIRQPASHCGVTGIKPTYGRASRWGMVAFASSLDQAGIFANSAKDAAVALQSICGFDAKDSTSVERDVDDLIAAVAENPSLKGKRLGVPIDYMNLSLHADVRKTFEQSLATLTSLGAEIVEVSLPSTALSLQVYMVIAAAECSSNLARYDGVHYGHRTESAKTLDELYSKTRYEGFGDEVKRRILLGTYVLSVGQYDAYYRRAQRVRRLIREDLMRAFDEVDLIVSPTTPAPAFAFGSKGDNPVNMYLEDLLTTSANLAGIPGISIPSGICDGLPIGLQIMGPDFSEKEILAAATAFQEVTEHHHTTPDLSHLVGVG